jgi:hypothetical protein
MIGLMLPSPFNAGSGSRSSGRSAGRSGSRSRSTRD